MADARRGIPIALIRRGLLVALVVFVAVVVGLYVLGRMGKPEPSPIAGQLEDEKRGAWWAERQQVVLREGSRVPHVSVRRETALYGREGELETLRQAWCQARDGEGRTILLEGEAGIGKTRLVDAFLDGLGGEDAHVLYGSYPPSGGLGGLSDAVLGHFESENLEAAIAPHLAATATLAVARSRDRRCSASKSIVSLVPPEMHRSRGCRVSQVGDRVVATVWRAAPGDQRRRAGGSLLAREHSGDVLEHGGELPPVR